MNRKTFSLALVAILALFCGAALAAGVQPTDFLSNEALSALGALGGMPFMAGETAVGMTVAEQRAQFETKRKNALARMKELMDTAAKEGRTLDEKEAEEYDGHEADIATIDKHLKRLDAHEKSLLAGGDTQAVNQNTGRTEEATQFRGVDIGNGSLSVRRNVEKGTGFVRFVMAVAGAKGNLLQAEKIAERWKDTPEVLTCIKAAVNAGTTTSTTWAGPLVQYQDLTSEFIELLRNATIIGRMNMLARVPFNVRIPRQTAGSAGTFVGEGKPTPVKELAFDNVTLQWAKASTIVVLTTELARFSDPGAEALVRRDLLGGIGEYLDKRLVDPAYAGVANVSPASLTNGVTPRQATGATLAALDADVRYVMTQFADANLGLQSGVWVMSASMAIRLSMMRTNQDSKAFPDLTVNGGTFYGLPVIVSNSVTGSGSPGDQFLILVSQNEVLLADDGGIDIDASSEASLQMNDAPSDGAQSLVSLWQNGLLGVKVERFINWTKRRSQAVQFIDKAQSYAS